MTKFVPTTATLTHAWRERLHATLMNGIEVSPRGMKTLELPQATTIFNMEQPVLMQPSRSLNYQFMLAEAWWILAGRNDVESISRYNKHISQFSDDGQSFAGAYGPMIRDQLDYVVSSLLSDRDTRQAGLTLWRPNPAKSKDIPCTIAMWFQLRENEQGQPFLNMHVFMRSSDLWLGLPYDSFNFTMVAATVVALLNQTPIFTKGGHVRLGTMHLTAASSHLYERNWEAARAVLEQDHASSDTPTVPARFYDGSALPVELLDQLKDTKKDDPQRWWHG